MNIQSFNDEWEAFLLKSGNLFNVMANYEFMLFIIGIQESGKGFGNYSKQEKTDLISLGVCKMLEQAGYMQANGSDADGWPQFTSLKDHNAMPPMQYNQLMKQNIMDYFNAKLSS